MSDFLNQSKLKYDEPRYDEIYVFINHMLTIAKSNPDIQITRDMVYSELEKFTLPGKDFKSAGQTKKVNHLFQEWINYFENIQNIKVYIGEDNQRWCRFINRAPDDNFIKLYIPIDSEGIEECVKEIFEFIASNDISHQSKIDTMLRNDNFVIRLNRGDEESLNKIISFITSNEKIKKYLNKTNPFIPNINAIGVINETGITYNGTISEIIAKYINEKRSQVKLNVEEFIKYMKNNIYKKEIYAAFEHATSAEATYFDSQENIYGYIKIKMNESQKYTLLNDALRDTYEKYGMEHLVNALIKILRNNDYSGISNEKEYRDLLERYISKDELDRLISYNIKTIYGREFTNIKDKLNAYCSYLFENQMITKLDEMCEVTLQNSGEKQLCGAIEEYIRTGNSNGFSRFKNNDSKNYRDNCEYIPQQAMISVIRKSLKVKGIDASYISNDTLAQIYAQTLKESRYEQELNEDDDIKIYR